MGYLYQIWDLDADPDDTTAPYTPYSFVPLGHRGPINMSMTRDFGRRESVMVIPGSDSVLDSYGRRGAPMDRRDMSFGFRVFTEDLDAAYDLLAAQVAPGRPCRLVYMTDGGALWFTIGFNAHIGHSVLSANRGGDSYADFTVTWRIRPDWRLRYSDLSTVWPYSQTTFHLLNDETFGTRGVVNINSTGNINFNVSTVGTAGLDMPTIPDYGPLIHVVGPAGGTTGFVIYNLTSQVRDQNNALQPRWFYVPWYLPSASYVISLDFARQRFLYNGLPFRPTKPNYQSQFFALEPNKVNSCMFTPSGASIVQGGQLTVDFYRKRA